MMQHVPEGARPGFQPRTLGRTGISVSPLGIASSYGVGTRDVLHARERGVDLFYWGSKRTRPFGAALRELCQREREQIRIVVQSYTRLGWFMPWSIEHALRRLGTDYVDLLLLGWWNRTPPHRILEAAARLCERGLAKSVIVSCHNRPSFVDFAREPRIGSIMVRYNAAHPGAETEVFPHLGEDRPGVIAYTATRWGKLLDPRLTPEGEPTPRGSDCYRFALSHPSVDAVFTGPRDRTELDEALTAIERGPMSEDELDWMKRVGRAVRGAPLRPNLASAAGVVDRLMGARGG